MRNRLGLLYGILVGLLLTIGVWWVYFLTHEGQVYAEYRLQKLATDRLHASFLIQADPQVATDPERYLGEAFPHLVFRRVAEGWDVDIEPSAMARIRAEASATRNMFLYEGLFFLLLLAAGSTILTVSGAARCASSRPASSSWPAPPTNSRRRWPACACTPRPSAARGCKRRGPPAHPRPHGRGRRAPRDPGRRGALDERRRHLRPGPALSAWTCTPNADAVLDDLRRFAGDHGVGIDLRGSARGRRSSATALTFAPGPAQPGGQRHRATARRRCASTSASRPGERWHRVTVRDDGPGIPRRLHDKVFECFYSDGRDSAPARGAGLGLYLVRATSRHPRRQGRAGQRRGTGQHLHHGAARHDRRRLDAGRPAGRQRRIAMKRRILVVEDDAHLADGLRINLELEGYEPVLAGSAEEGLDLWRRGGVDLILLDVMLPGMDGFEFCRQVRREGDRVPDPLPDRPRRRPGPHPRPGRGRRRLHHQALRAAGAAGAHQVHLPPPGLVPRPGGPRDRCASAGPR